MSITMPRTLLSFLVLAGLLLALASAARAAEAGDKDRIIQKSGPVIEAAEVVAETSETVSYKLTPTAQLATKRSGTILRVEYAEMRGGAYGAGVAAMARGAYDEAADRFHAVAESEKEWEKVYGSLAEGDAQEQGKHFPEAVKAFQAALAAAPKHRLALDATYRLGMNQAWAKDPEAAKTVDGLSELGKGTVGQPAEARANAIRCAMALAVGNAAKFEEYAKKTNLRASEEPDTWFHFNLWLADAYRQAGKGKDAARIIDGMLPQLDADPARKAQAIGIKGLALVDSDPQAAVIELLKLDLLPFGSEEQRCDARYNAGKLLLAEATALAANPDTAKDERKTAFVKELQNSARLVLQGAVDSPTSQPSKDLAKTLLATLPEPVAPADPAAAPAAK